jgi:NADPH:quinone reductase-like Zn-dependent oxidoreductase
MACDSFDGIKGVSDGAYALFQGEFAWVEMVYCMLTFGMGTGGVGMFSLIVCLSAGIRSIVTPLSEEKLVAIKKLSREIQNLNCKAVIDRGAEVQRLTDGRGVHFVVNNTEPKFLIDVISFLSRGAASSRS